MLLIQDITKFTLQDYPENTACIVWFSGCNLRCKYCHNPDIVNNHHKFFSEEEVLDFLEKRKELLDGVVFSGGECTMSDGLYDFAKKVKEFGYKIKIDTNGINYDMVYRLVEDKVIDFVALDFKSLSNNFSFITQREYFDKFEKSLKYLIERNNEDKIDLEIRTTVHTDLLDEDDINGMIEYLDNSDYRSDYFIQNFRNDNNNLLSDLREQEYILDRNKLINPKNFNIYYRNFF